MIKYKLSNNKFINLVFLIFYSTIIIGFLYNEDSLGGAKGDYLYHLAISNNFSSNFFNTWDGFGYGETGLQTRNSPVFWIIISLLNKFLSHDLIRILNTSSSLLIAIFFFKCLCLKFKKIDKKTLSLIACSVIFLSPTIRSLAIWPYSLIWGLLLFIISIYNYLLFEQKKDYKKKTISSFYSIFYLALSSYIYPSFAVFSIFYLIQFLKFFKISKNFIIVLFLNFLIAVPALYFLITKGFYFFGAQGIAVSTSTSFNISNKIIIISSLLLYFLIPILDIKETYKNFKKKINFKSLFLLILLTSAIIIFFDYPYISSGGFGGGFFHKVSNIILGNNLLLYLSFFVFLNIYFSVFKNNLKNYLLFFTLILFNLQFTIYNKYFDPLLLILLFFVFDFKLEKHIFKNKNQLIKLFSILFIYLLLGLFKSNIFTTINAP